MNPYQSRGTGDGNAKRKRKRRSANKTVEIKQEVVVKEEPRGSTQMVDVTHPQRRSPSAEVIGTIKSEAETDSEMCFEYDDDCVKKQVKSEDEGSKKNCDSAQGLKSSNCDDNYSDEHEQFGGNGSIPRRNSKSKDRHNKRSATIKKLKNRKKGTSARASKKAAMKRQKKHMCHLCNYSTSKKSSLTDHIRVHTGERPFVCKVCEKSFTQKSHLRRHEKTHGPRFAFRCSKCRKGFAEEIDKIDHEFKCERRQYECYVCKYTTCDLTTLKYHIHTHSGRKPFECPVCSKMFTRKSSLRSHLRTHKNQLPFACSKCGQRFAEENAKESHEKRCNCRRFECHLCQYKCFRGGDLIRHLRPKHTGEKPFECAVCGKRFSQKYHMKKHLATHTKPRVIRCSKCWKRFAVEDKKNVHEGRCNCRFHQCHLCKVNAAGLTHLKYHMRVRHKNHFHANSAKLVSSKNPTLIFT